MADRYLEQLLGDREEIRLITRQHWTVLAAEILSESLLTLALIVLVSLVWAVAPPPYNLYAPFGYVLLIFPLLSLGRDVADWLNRQYVVTNRRVVELEGVLNKDVTDSSLEKVNDVKLEQSFLGRMLNYGDLSILTASELGINVFKRIAGPITFKTAMLNAKAQLESGNKAAPRPGAPSVPDLITQLDVLRQNGLLTEAEFQAKKSELLKKL
ncbi:MAG: PH domain-containing protein [Anaerolineales bacterium]